MKHPNGAACLHVIQKHPWKCQSEYPNASYLKKRKSDVGMWTPLSQSLQKTSSFKGFFRVFSYKILAWLIVHRQKQRRRGTPCSPAMNRKKRKSFPQIIFLMTTGGHNSHRSPRGDQLVRVSQTFRLQNSFEILAF